MTFLFSLILYVRTSFAAEEGPSLLRYIGRRRSHQQEEEEEGGKKEGQGGGRQHQSHQCDEVGFRKSAPRKIGILPRGNSHSCQQDWLENDVK